MPIPTISPGEMQLLLSRAGLVLNPGQVADLVLAWRQVAGLIATIPHDRPLADDMAYAFRLPPPASAAVAVPRARPAAKPKAKARPKAKAKAKAAPRRRAAAKPVARKPARRRR
jgi:pyruvate/2-oxoglutarate dehydrogenase complex dihydrolipoamide acyltransferase (E2) component